MNKTNKIKILIIKNNKELKLTLEDILNDRGYYAVTKKSIDEGLKFLQKETIDIIIIDYQLKGMRLTDLLSKIKRLKNKIEVLIINGSSSDKIIQQAIKNGAYDYITKPFITEDLINKINHITDLINIKKKESNLEFGYYFSDIMNKITDKIKTIAKTDLPVLITGESGTGKEVIARLCHYYSKNNKNFISINCSALPYNLLESELFGEEKNNTAGNIKTKIGFLESANQGTLFFEKIGDMPFDIQIKVLRAIQEKEIYRVGGSMPVKINTRIIASTNKNLEDEIKLKKFREDLYYRLNIVKIEIPPLRYRKEEIKPLAIIFLKKFSAKYNKNIKGFDDEVFTLLKNYDWHGNIRELKNKIEYAVITADKQWISLKDISLDDKTFLNSTNFLLEKDYIIEEKKYDYNKNIKNLNTNYQQAKRETLNKFEKEFLTYHLEKNHWNVNKTAKTIGLFRQELYKRIKLLKINKT